MMQTSRSTTRVPPELHSPKAKLVYLYLSTHGGATITELQENLGMKKLSLYGILKTLQEEDIVGRRTDRYVLS
ncbi:MAG: TrmB family transcriptional regulator [Haloferacaceae archaeon]